MKKLLICMCLLFSIVQATPKIYYNKDLKNDVFNSDIILISDINDENWKSLPYKLHYLDISNVNHLSEVALKKLKRMEEVDNLFISNLGLFDKDIKMMPKIIEYIDLSYNPITKKSLDLLAERKVKKVKITGTLIDKNLELNYENMEIRR